MKKLVLCLLCFLAIGAYAQDTVKKSNSIGDFNEQLMVLKSDKKVRQGSYQLFYHKKMVASGHYDQGKKTGLWNFYNNDQLVQQYDYTTNKLVQNTPETELTYEIADNTGDAGKTPVKIGGLTAGIKLMLAYVKFDDKIADLTGDISVVHTIKLDETGKVTSWKAFIRSADGLKAETLSFDDVPEADQLFLPATLNGKAVSSIISFKDTKGGSEEADAGNSKVQARGKSGRRKN